MDFLTEAFRQTLRDMKRVGGKVQVGGRRRGRNKARKRKKRGGFGFGLLHDAMARKGRALKDNLTPVFDSAFRAYIHRKRQAGERITSKQKAFLRHLNKK